MDSKRELLIVGLGNPGKQYYDTRHNVGFLAIDRLQEHYNFSWSKSKFNAFIATHNNIPFTEPTSGRQVLGDLGTQSRSVLNIHEDSSTKSTPQLPAEVRLYKSSNGSHKFLFAKPTTYMNLSGGALQAICSYYKIPLSQVIVIHDDIDLEVARVKFKLGGGSGGHNGLKSIDQHLGNNYYRIRIGVGRPTNNMEVSDYVLSRFGVLEGEQVTASIEKIKDNFDFLLDGKIEEFKKRVE